MSEFESTLGSVTPDESDDTVAMARTKAVFMLNLRSEPARLAPAAMLMLDAFFALVCGLVVAIPWNATVRMALRANSPDETIFRDDPLELMEMLTRPSGQGTLGIMLVVTLFATWLTSFLPFGALLSSINTESHESMRGGGFRSQLRFHLAHGAYHYVRTASVGTLFGLLRLVVLFVAGMAASGVHGSLRQSTNDARADIITLIVFAVVSLLIVPVSALEDCVHAARFRGATNPPRRAFAALRKNFGRLFASFALRSALGFALGAVGLVLLRGPLAQRAIVLFAAHQLLFFGRAGVRAWWLAVASQCVARGEAESETVAASPGEPV